MFQPSGFLRQHSPRVAVAPGERLHSRDCLTMIVIRSNLAPAFVHGLSLSCSSSCGRHAGSCLPFARRSERFLCCVEHGRSRVLGTPECLQLAFAAAQRTPPRVPAAPEGTLMLALGSACGCRARMRCVLTIDLCPVRAKMFCQDIKKVCKRTTSTMLSVLGLCLSF